MRQTRSRFDVLGGCVLALSNRRQLMPTLYSVGTGSNHSLRLTEPFTQVNVDVLA